MRARLFVMLFAVTLCAHANSELLEHVPLQWKPTSELRLGAMQMSQAPIQFESFQDVRDNRDAIGENLEDAKPKPVTTGRRCRCVREQSHARVIRSRWSQDGQQQWGGND